MGERPQRLGRGLAALLGGQGGPTAPEEADGTAASPESGEPTPDGTAAPASATPAPSAEESPVGDVVSLEVSRIGRNPDQPRRRFDERALEALAESLRETGLVQPVVVRPVDDGYVLIAGERRWRAAQRAGLERIPALIREADEREQLEIALIENVVREDLNPMELAHAVAALVEDFGRTHDAVAATLGRSRPAISNLLRLLELPEVVQEMVSDGRLSEGHGRAVLGADGAGARRRLAERIIAEGLSVRQAEALARGGVRSSSAGRDRQPIEGGARVLDAFYGAFDVPVRVRSAGKGMVVELRFPDTETLARVLDRLEDEVSRETSGSGD